MKISSNQIEQLPSQTGFKVVGKVKDAQGIKGEIFIRLFAGQSDWLEKLSTLRLIQNKQVRIFEIVRARAHKNGLVVKMKNCETRNDAELLKGCYFEIDEKLLVANPGEKIYLNEIMGFMVNVQNLGEIGCVVGFKYTGYQDLMIVTYRNKEVMIPFIQPFISSIDFTSKIIALKLPEGLLEL